MMKRKIAVTLVTTALVCAGGYGASVLAASATGNSNATIVAPIAIAPTATELNFGDISPNTATPGTVTVDTASARTGSGVGLVAGGTVSAGVFNVTGCANCAFNVTAPTPGALLTGPGLDMTITAFTTINSSPLDGAGAGTVTVGGTLAVGANQTAGAYAGTYAVTVDYP